MNCESFETISIFYEFLATLFSCDHFLHQYFSKDSFVLLLFTTLNTFGVSIIQSFGEVLSFLLMQFNESLFRKYNDFVHSNDFHPSFGFIYYIFSRVIQFTDLQNIWPIISYLFKNNELHYSLLIVHNIIQLGKTNEEKNHIINFLLDKSLSLFDFVVLSLSVNPNDALYSLKIINFCLSSNAEISFNNLKIFSDILETDEIDVKSECCQTFYYLLMSNQNAEILMNSIHIQQFFDFIHNYPFRMKQKSMLVLCIGTSHMDTDVINYLNENGFIDDLLDLADPDDNETGKLILQCLLTQLQKSDEAKNYIGQYINEFIKIYQESDRTISIYLYHIMSYFENDE